MALQTPGHVQRLSLIYMGHFIHLAMAYQATYTRIHMCSMIEVHIVRQVIDFFPRYRHARFVAFAYPSQRCAMRGNCGVAVHAGLGRGQSGKSRTLYIGVAVLAVNAQFSGMKGVAVGNGLHGLVINV